MLYQNLIQIRISSIHSLLISGRSRKDKKLIDSSHKGPIKQQEIENELLTINHA